MGSVGRPACAVLDPGIAKRAVRSEASEASFENEATRAGVGVRGPASDRSSDGWIAMAHAVTRQILGDSDNGGAFRQGDDPERLARGDCVAEGLVFGEQWLFARQGEARYVTLTYATEG